jgi:hypothetical protein
VGKNGKGKSLGGLADAFVKAGVASEKSARGARRERASEDRELGREGLERRQAERERELAHRRAEEADRERTLAAQRREAGETERLRSLVAAHAETARGPRRWFFVARDGRIPFVEVSDAVARQLADGHAGVVENPGEGADEHLVVAGRQALTAIEQAEPALVRFWNKDGGRR